MSLSKPSRGRASARLVITISLVGLSIASVPARAAVTLVWGNELGSTNIDSSGTAALDSSFSASLGTFSPGFVPLVENMDSWEANWVGAATAQYNMADSYFSGQTPIADNAVFPVGAPLYIWLRNSAPLQAGGEWFLVTDDSSDGDSADNWIMPEAAGTGQTKPPVHLEIACSPANPLNVIFGGLGDNGSGLPIQSGGLYSDPSEPDWCLQTHTLMVVPEPGAATLVLAGAILIFRRTSRKNGQHT